MTSTKKNRNSGPPPPITELTMEQDLKLRQIHDALKRPETSRDDIIILLMALQEQCYVLSNCVTNLLQKWPKHEEHVPIRTGEGISIHIWDQQQPKPPIQKQAEESDS